MASRVLTVIPFHYELNYTLADIEFMLPGIINKVYCNNSILFNALVNESLTPSEDDDTHYVIKLNYYDNFIIWL